MLMKKLLSGSSTWIRLNILLLACMIVMRPVFFLEVYFRIGLAPIHFFTILSGSVFDLLLVCRILTFGLVPFLLLHYFFPKTIRGVYIGLIVIYVVVNALLAEYYCNLTVPLDHVVLVYSHKDLMTTLSSSSSLSLAQVFWFLLQVILSILLICKWKHFELGKWPTLSIVLACLLTTFLVNYHRLVREERLYPTHYDFCLAVNQPSYSVLKITDYLKQESYFKFILANDSYDQNLRNAVITHQSLHPEYEYDTPDYPFYRKFTETDVLAPFLNVTTDSLPPNFVFVLVEGLGQRLTGVYNPMLSFTPFIDSLASEGLYWQHCFSTAERTFGVIPSVFASAPHGRYGFSTTLAPTPRHNSLLRDLSNNGYYTSFFYGGDPAFDNYDSFMSSNLVDFIFSPELFVNDSARYQLLGENHRWGLDDAQLFQSLKQQKIADSLHHRPFADVILTLSTHEPFVVDSIGRYEKTVEQMVENTAGLSDKERNNVLKNKNIFACYLYMDESLRYLFNYYASRTDYQNTIFVITGDHRMAPLQFVSSIHKYNVPLVIYSPLLKRNKAMDAVVSHLDITPTVNAYLSANYDYYIDDHCHWLGTTLDTVKAFRNTRKLLFMLNNRDVVDYYSGDFFISTNNLIRLNNRLEETMLHDAFLFSQLKAEMEAFDMLGRFVVQKDHLMPLKTHNHLFQSCLDFKTTSSNLFDKLVVQDSSFVRVDTELEYLHLCSNLTIQPRYHHLYVEVSFDVRSIDTVQPLPFLVVSYGDKNTTQRLLSPSFESLNTGEWEHFYTRVLVDAENVSTIDVLKIFLWNKAKTGFDIDNLVVNVDFSLRETSD